MFFLDLFVALFIAFFGAAFLCYVIVTRWSQVLLDHPNDRSLHAMPVSRLGGVAIWVGVACAVLLRMRELADFIDIYFCVAVVLLLLIALLDDKHGLHPFARLIAQAAAASLLVWGGGVYVSAVWFNALWPIFGVVVLMWCINLYNFMDGMDGFAGSMGAIGLASLSILGVMQEQTAFALLCAIIAAACAGFLCFNFPPARIFMGDSGSTVLGLAMGALSIQGYNLDIYSLWVPLLIFSPFWLDATATLLRRLCKGEKVWLPHRQHYYQRWVLAGYSHRRVLGVNICLMLACSATVIIQQWMQYSPLDIVLPLAWVVCYGSLVLLSERKLWRADDSQ